MKYLYNLIVLATFVPLLGSGVRAQTYTQDQLEGAAPLSWQTQFDPAGRLLVGQDDGNVFAFANSASYASVIRYGGADGLTGLLDDFTVSSEGPPTAFGLARSGCIVTDAASFEQCVKVRWTPEPILGGQLIMQAVLVFPGGIAVVHDERDAMPGDAFSIERDGPATINFYRSTGVPGERRRVFSFQSPFNGDGQTGQLEVRGAFATSSANMKISQAQEMYYCCL